ncbi:MAG: hypothetical protein AB7F64_07260 [Gammaproteobacteria bacterium]
MKKKACFVELSKIEYADREQEYGEHNEYHPCVIKPKIYGYQKEVRAIWEPKTKAIELFLLKLDVKYIKRSCEIYSEK